jgi:hypothetical protein
MAVVRSSMYSRTDRGRLQTRNDSRGSGVDGINQCDCWIVGTGEINAIIVLWDRPEERRMRRMILVPEQVARSDGLDTEYIYIYIYIYIYNPCSYELE